MTVIIDTPFTCINSAGYIAYHGSIGMGLRLPAANNWRITPAVRLAAAYSSDLGAMSAIYSISGISDYSLYFGDLTATIGNMLGYYMTDSIDTGVYNIDYDLKNTYSVMVSNSKVRSSFSSLVSPRVGNYLLWIHDFLMMLCLLNSTMMWLFRLAAVVG